MQTPYTGGDGDHRVQLHPIGIMLQAGTVLSHVRVALSQQTVVVPFVHSVSVVESQQTFDPGTVTVRVAGVGHEVPVQTSVCVISLSVPTQTVGSSVGAAGKLQVQHGFDPGTFTVTC